MKKRYFMGANLGRSALSQKAGEVMPPSSGAQAAINALAGSALTPAQMSFLSSDVQDFVAQASARIFNLSQLVIGSAGQAMNISAFVPTTVSGSLTSIPGNTLQGHVQADAHSIVGFVNNLEGQFKDLNTIIQQWFSVTH